MCRLEIIRYIILLYVRYTEFGTVGRDTTPMKPTGRVNRSKV